MNKYIGVVLAFLALLSMVPRMIAETKGMSLVAPGLFIVWAAVTLVASYNRGEQPRNPEMPRKK